MNTLKITLWLSALFNLVAAYFFAFPSSYLGQFVGLPSTVSPVYRAMTAFMIALFAAAYGWLAIQAEPVKPLLFFGAAGKLGVFLLAVGLWRSGAISTTLFVVGAGDLAFALLWFWWLGKTDR